MMAMMMVIMVSLETVGMRRMMRPIVMLRTRMIVGVMILNNAAREHKAQSKHHQLQGCINTNHYIFLCLYLCEPAILSGGKNKILPFVYILSIAIKRNEKLPILLPKNQSTSLFTPPRVA